MPKTPEPPKPTETTPPETTPASDELGLESESPKPPETKPDDAPATDKPPEKMLDEKGKPVDTKKVSPWKLLDQFKGRLTAAEKENVELKERLTKMADVEAASKQIESIQKRNQELEEEIKYQNYSKSKEYEEKYQKPYEAAWAKAAKELAELEVLDETGTVTRHATSQDLIALANMPLGQARKTATAMFGDSANDVMLHRQRIIDLSDAQREALETARKSGSDRQEQSSVKQQAVAKEVGTLWEQFNSEAASKLEYLKPKEGDNDWNAALTKAQSLVDTAFGQSPIDPNLPPEQRAKIVKAHAAIRNRAIAYSSLKLENTRLRTQIAERDAKLKEYEGSEPGAGNGSKEGAKAVQPAHPMDRAKARLRAEAVPAPNYF